MPYYFIENFYKEENTMIKKSIKTHTRLLTCLVALAVVFATFLAGTFTTQAGTDVFGDIELKVGDTLGFVYYTSQPYADNTKMRFTVNGRTSESEAYENDGKCVFIFNDIYPHELAKEVTATIVVNDQETVSSTGLSIKSFLLQMLMDPNSSPEERQFASDTLQYGEQTRLYRNANVDVADRDYDSITEDINSSIYTHYKPQDIDANFVGSAMGLGVSASNIRLSSIGIAYHNTNRYVVTLQVPHNSNVNLSNIKVKIGDKEFTSTAFVDKGNGQYEIQSDPINAYDILDGANPRTTQFTLLVNNKVVQQASYNILDYIYQLQDTTQGGSLALKYARSLYRYGQSAEAAYKGNRIVAIALNKGPGDDNGQMVPGSKDAQTPTGGSITAYYSDGTSLVINEGIVWKNTDIYGNEIKITDDTHTKKFTVEGSYYDDTSGKTYTVTGTIELHNDMVLVERYTDPSVYSPTEFRPAYTPTGAELSCKWANGYTDVRSAENKYIMMSAYRYHEYGFIPTEASYTDPKSNITLSTETFLLYNNPIQSITINDTTANFNDGTLNNTTTPIAPKYSVTYSNGQAVEKSGNWTNTITSGNTSQTLSYEFTLANLVYSGYDITVTRDVNGALQCSAHNTWERMESGSAKVYAGTTKTITGTCKVTATNGEKELKITTAPSVYGGTVTSKNNLTGNPNSTVNGELTGGTVTMTYYNGAVETITANGISYSTSDTIKDAAYSKTVTVTATYTGKDGNKHTGSTNTTIYNWIKSIAQDKNAVVNAANYSSSTVQVTESALNKTIKVTYYNTATDVRGDASSIAVSLNNNTRTEFYVANVTNATIGDTVRTNASAASSGTPAYQIVVTYTDSRSGANYDATKRTQKITGYKIAVRNDVTGFVANQSKICTMTSNTGSTITPTGTVKVNLTNGQTANITPTYAAVSTITTATETASRTSTITYTSSLNKTITGSVSVTVTNPITSVVLYTDPANITLTKTTAITASDLSGCQLTATYTNGKTNTIAANTYSNLTNAKITNGTRMIQCQIKAGYSSSYSNPTQVNANVILLNPITSTTLNLSTFTSSSRGWITATGGAPAGKIQITFSNTYSYEYTPTTLEKLYKTGTTSSSGNTANTPTGEYSINGTYNVAAAGPYYRYVSGKTSTTPTQYAAETKTASAKAYWKNKPISATVKSCSVTVADKSQAQVTPVMELNVTWETGGTSVQNATCDKVNNITDTTTSKNVTCTGRYTANGATVSASTTATMTNSVKSYVATNVERTFPGSTTTTVSITGTATYQNNATATRNASSLSNFRRSNSSSITFSSSGNSITATCTASGAATTTATYTATYGGQSDDVTFKAINTYSSLVAYLDSNRTDMADSTSGGLASYPAIGYFSDDRTTISDTARLYFKVYYSNKTSANVSWSDVKFTTNPGITGKYIYGPNDTWAAGNMKTYQAGYPKSSPTVYVSFSAMPCLYYENIQLSVDHTKAEYTGTDTDGIDPSKLKITFSAPTTTYVLSCGGNRTATGTGNTYTASSWTLGGAAYSSATPKDATYSTTFYTAKKKFTDFSVATYQFIKCKVQVSTTTTIVAFPKIVNKGSTSTVYTNDIDKGLISGKALVSNVAGTKPDGF